MKTLTRVFLVFLSIGSLIWIAACGGTSNPSGDGGQDGCTPDCSSRVCGPVPNGCGPSCGNCQSPATCNVNLGQCENCAPDCGARVCGPVPNSCGESCGSCANPTTCNLSSGQCENCSPDCGARVCGPVPNGCGESCGSCTNPPICNMISGQCENCTPDCGARVCGPVPNGCGESCGDCENPGVCNEFNGQCLSPISLEILLMPNAGQAGDSINMSLFCADPAFGTDTAMDFGDQVRVLAYEQVDAYQIYARIFIQYDATPGPRDVVVMTSQGFATLPLAFDILPNDASSGLISFSLVKENTSSDAKVSAVAVFSDPGPNLDWWLSGIPPAPQSGQIVFGCTDSALECYQPPTSSPTYNSAGDFLNISDSVTAIQLERTYFDPGNNPSAFVYTPAQAVPVDFFRFETVYSASSSGGLDVPAFSKSFAAPADLEVISHDLRQEKLDVVKGLDLTLEWVPQDPPSDNSEVHIVMARIAPMIGIFEWLATTVPDTGVATIPAAEIEKLRTGFIGTYLWRQAKTSIVQSEFPKIELVAKVLQIGAGDIYPAGSQVVHLLPNHAMQGETLDIEVKGINTHFQPNDSTINFGPGIMVNTFEVSSATSAVANVTLLEPRQAVPGSRNVLIHTTSPQPEDLSLPEYFYIQEAVPVCTVQEATPAPHLVPGDVACGTIAAAGEKDVFDFQGQTGQVVVVTSRDTLFGSELYDQIRLYGDAGLTQLLYEYPWGEGTIAFLLEADQTYYLTIEDRYGDFGSAYFYYLQFDLFDAQALPNQECPQVVGSLAPGFYVGDTLTFTNTHFTDDPEFQGCLEQKEMGGFDTVYSVPLASGETMVAWLMHPFADSSIYLLQDCADITTCLIGHDHEAWRLPEFLSFRNDTGTTATYTLVVDSYWSENVTYEQGGAFFLRLYKF